MIPDALVLLANLGRPRRPRGASAPRVEPVLPDATTATRQLAPLISRPVTAPELPDLRRVQQIAVQAADALLAGRLPDPTPLNAIVGGSTARVELAMVDGALWQHLAWSDASIAAGLARQLIEEVATLEPIRLRRCARAACGLLFYDTTRSRTRRWHAEVPCGWRERQHRRRTRG